MKDRTPMPFPPNDRSSRAPDVGALIGRASPRAEVPPEHLAQLKAVAREEWQREWPQASRSQRPWIAVAAAAVVGVLISFAVFRGLNDTPAPAASAELVAEIVRLTGRVVAGNPGSTRIVEAGNELARGDLLEVETGVAALRFRNGLSLRLLEGSRVAFVDERSIRLDTGRIYADSGPHDGGDPMIHVSTLYGTVTDMGTQFEVDLPAKGLRLRVREGSVRLEHDETAHTATAGQQLSVDAGGVVSLEPTPIWGDDWSWILEAAAPYGGEPTLGAYLDWVARETGWEVRLLAPEAAQGELQGTLELLRTARPDEAIDDALAASGLSSRFEGGTLFVGPANGE